MNQDVFSALLALAEEPPMMDKTLSYLTEQLGPSVEPGENVLICAPGPEPGKLSALMGQAVLRCGGIPVFWGEDRRWKSLLRLAFTTRATTIIGSPLVILGLSKLKKANNTPLYIHHAVTAGYPCFDWMMEGIEKGLDCKGRACFSMRDSAIVAGFSCSCSRGIHLRSDEYALEVRDEQGDLLPAGEDGRWILSPRGCPELSHRPGGFGRLDLSPCPCGDPSPRIVDLRPVEVEDRELADLSQYLLSWTSILDFTVCRGPYGLEIEMIIFPGEKLPKLPTCARQVIRPWDPETDEPIPFIPGRKNTAYFADSH